MKKFMSLVLTGAVALSAGAYYISPAQQTSLTANADSLGFLYYSVVDDHVEITGCVDMIMGDIVIPDNIENKPVTSINKDAFRGRTLITSVEIPSTVTYIGVNAFNGCTAMESVKIPEGVDFIDENAFRNCTSLKSVSIPSTVTKMAAHIFRGCSSIENATFADGLSYIGVAVLGDCENLKSVKIPSSVGTIDVYAFAHCPSLESVTIPEGVTEIRATVFESCPKIKSIVLPESVSKLGYKRDGFIDTSRTFIDCESLQSVTILNPYCDIIQQDGMFPENTVIRGYKNSTANAYAITYGLKFEEIEAVKGDANEDGKVTIADAVAILQYLANSDEYPLSEQGMKNADVTGDGNGVNTNDALQIQKWDAGVIEKL